MKWTLLLALCLILVVSIGGYMWFFDRYFDRSRERHIGTIEELSNGTGSITVSLPVRTASWYVRCGSPAKNGQLTAEHVRISVKNTGNHTLYHSLHLPPFDSTKFREISIEPDEEATLFEGAMGDFWGKLHSLRFSTRSAGWEMSCIMQLQFERVIELQEPIAVDADYRDAAYSWREFFPW